VVQFEIRLVTATCKATGSFHLFPFHENVVETLRLLFPLVQQLGMTLLILERHPLNLLRYLLVRAGFIQHLARDLLPCLGGLLNCFGGVQNLTGDLLMCYRGFLNLAGYW